MPSCTARSSAAFVMSGSGKPSGAKGARSYATPPTLRTGAVDALSTPPAARMRWSPARIADTASTTAARPLPHWRSTVPPGTSAPSPLARAAILPGFPPGPMQLPRSTSATVTGAPVAALASASAARMTGALSCATPSAARARPRVPIGVRRAAMMTGSRSDDKAVHLPCEHATNRLGAGRLSGHRARQLPGEPLPWAVRGSQLRPDALVQTCRAVALQLDERGDQRTDPIRRHAEHDRIAHARHPAQHRLDLLGNDRRRGAQDGIVRPSEQTERAIDEFGPVADRRPAVLDPERTRAADVPRR